MASPATFTPVGLVFDEPRHAYDYAGRRMLSVTGVLAAAALIDRGLYTEADGLRGTRVHAAIELITEDPTRDFPDPDIAPFVAGFRRFLAESAFRVDASEERLVDVDLQVAGTLDLRGEFIGGYPRDLAGPTEGRIDIIDVKTGARPPWVGYQTAGYVRLLPVAVRPRCRRWCLQLREDGGYTLIALTNRHDERVFVAAVTIAHAKRGWLL